MADTPAEKSEEQVFQVGITVCVTQLTDVIIRVKAKSWEEARELARNAAIDDIRGSFHMPHWMDSTEFEFLYAEVEGLSQTDYSDMGRFAYPNPDLDLTQDEPCKG
uniref:Uncharacterized protein n=1 Tax=viral metagenome TaxID=1070528 RepID=A0A6H2A016_9ZZZZ